MKNVRAFEIVDYLRKKKYCTLTELMQVFKVSQATIHRDVAALEERKLVQKLHGGVALAETEGEMESKEHQSSPYTERINKNRQWKQKIALQALQTIEEGDIIFLDSSTTVYYLSELLKKSNLSSLTIVTNSVSIIQEFHNFPLHYVLIGIGGAYDLQLNSFLGQSALAELGKMKISKAYISAFGIDDDNAMTNHEHHAIFLQHVLSLAEKSYLLADHSKFGRAGLFKIAARTDFCKIIHARNGEL